MSNLRSNHASASHKHSPESHRIFVRGNLDFNDGTKSQVEKNISKVKFNRQIFTPNTDKPIVFLSALVEFGCESLLPHYFLPNFASGYRDYHRIVVGWPGRSLYYSPFVSEFWSIDPKLSYLRDYTKAFNTMSKNIRNIENALKDYGSVFKSGSLNSFFCEGACLECKKKFLSMFKVGECHSCKSNKIINSVIADSDLHRNKYNPLPLMFGHLQPWLDNCVKTNKAVGIFARSRTTYGRNLPKEFYKKLCSILESKGYEILWLGEKVSTLKCISKHFFDFTTSEYSDSLEHCFGLVSRCVGTFQAWTASTRFSQALNIPYCLVESYDQLFGNGQEGKRINLLTRDFNKKKIIISNYRNVLARVLDFADVCADHFCDFIENGNSDDIVGFVENPELMRTNLKAQNLWKTI